MINNIEEFINSLNIKGKSFCDLFSGSASGASIVNYKGSATSTMSASGGSIVSHVN